MFRIAKIPNGFYADVIIYSQLRPFVKFFALKQKKFQNIKGFIFF